MPGIARGVPIEILDTRQPEHGDFSCNYALIAAKAAGANPRALAETIRSALESGPWAANGPLIREIDIAGPGFLNFRLNPEAIAGFVPQILSLGDRIVQTKGDGAKLSVEFVSVNPNGPITVGSGRGAAFGDALCRILAAAGHHVTREYYINDGVNSEQMRLFAESVRFYYRGSEGEFPENGYRGEYVEEVAHDLRARFGDGHGGEDTPWFQARSQEMMIERQRSDLALFGVNFDVWFSEQSLHDSGEVDQQIDRLIAKGAADEQPYRVVLKLGKGGAVAEVAREEQPESDETLWLRSTKFGDDMDRVLRRKDGRLTYIASDVAYHWDKLTDASGRHGSGPVDRLITILGPDHHGYIARLQAVLAALLEPGESTETAAPSPIDSIYRSAQERASCEAAIAEARRRLEVVIFQIVRFMKDGQPAPMRKRDGNIYELRDLIEELGAAVSPQAPKEEQLRIGRDVARFFYLARSHDTHMDFDIDLATKQSDENPVFYVQYAHARICSVLRKAGDADQARLDPSFLTDPRELNLIRKVLDLPWEVRRAAEDYGVHRIATYAIELARAFHHFYDGCRVIQADQPEMTRARLALCQAARLALAAALDLLGVSAPERMDRSDLTG